MKFYTLERNHMFGIEQNIIEDFELMSMLKEALESGKVKEIKIKGDYWYGDSRKTWTSSYANWLFSFVEYDIITNTNFFILDYFKLYSHSKALEFISESLKEFPYEYGEVLEKGSIKEFNEMRYISIILINDKETKYTRIQGEKI